MKRCHRVNNKNVFQFSGRFVSYIVMHILHNSVLGLIKLNIGKYMYSIDI
jgi:hypothetical protein